MIHIFEPHGDDALISCYPILKKHAEETVVVTVGDSRSSKGLEKHFPGLTTCYEQVYEIPNQIGRAAYLKDFREWQKPSPISFFIAQGVLMTPPDKGTPWQWQRDITTNKNGELWKESRCLTYEVVQSYLMRLSMRHRESDDRPLILAPIGLLHPYHICLADVMFELSQELKGTFDFGFYSEAPYNSSKWVRNLEYSHPGLNNPTPEMMAKCISTADVVEKERIFREVYPSEVKIFRFTREEVLYNQYWFYLPPSWYSKI